MHVGVAADRTIEVLKGRRPVNTEQERLYMIRALKAVHEAWVCTGVGMLEFADDIRRLRPDIMYVNADGANLEKENLCRELGIAYRVGERVPHSGLPARSTTSYRAECRIPYRLDVAGAWLDQPAFSRLAPGPVLTLSIEPDEEFIDRAGLATSTRKKAIELWQTQLPAHDPMQTARTLFCYENPPGSATVSGSQDALGMVLPGFNRLHYAGDYWPDIVDSCLDEAVLSWLERHLRLVFVKQRASDFDPYAGADITPEKVGRLAAAAEACWQTAPAMDFPAFAKALSESFTAQIAMLPAMATPETLETAKALRDAMAGWKLMGAGGGGYLMVATENPAPTMIRFRIRRNAL